MCTKHFPGLVKVFQLGLLMVEQGMKFILIILMTLKGIAQRNLRISKSQ